jgi:hypothetical protein
MLTEMTNSLKIQGMKTKFSNKMLFLKTSMKTGTIYTVTVLLSVRIQSTLKSILQSMQTKK